MNGMVWLYPELDIGVWIVFNDIEKSHLEDLETHLVEVVQNLEEVVEFDGE